MLTRAVSLLNSAPFVSYKTNMTSKATTLSGFTPRLSSVTKTKAKSAKRCSRSTSLVSSVSFVGLCAVVLSLGFYIYTINASVSKGYELKQQQAAMEELKETQKRLMVQQAAMGAIVKVNDVASTAGMVPITDEEFLVANQLSSR